MQVSRQQRSHPPGYTILVLYITCVGENLEYITIKIHKKTYEALKKLRIHRPDIAENVYEKTFAVVLMDLINKGDKQMIKIKESEIRSMAENYASELRKLDIGLTEEVIGKLEKLAHDSLIKSYETPVRLFEIVYE